MQVTLLFVYISRKKEYFHDFAQSFFERGNRDVRDEKMKAKYIEEYVWKSFFRKLAGWYLSTSLWINFFTDNFPDSD